MVSECPVARIGGTGRDAVETIVGRYRTREITVTRLESSLQDLGFSRIEAIRYVRLVASTDV